MPAPKASAVSHRKERDLMVSPYLNRPLRSLDEVLQARGQAERTTPERRAPGARGAAPVPKASPDNRFVDALTRREAA